MFITEMMTRWKSNNVRMGRIVSKASSSQLDSCTIIITQETELDIECYDMVKLDDEYWLVANFNKNIVSRNPLLFEYMVDLVELTKLFEGIVVPCMAITNIGQDPNRKVSTYIRNIFNRYFKKDYDRYYLVDNMGSISLGDISMGISTNINTIFNYDFFECEWGDSPTLREVLDTLMGDKGYCCKLRFENDRYVLDVKNLNPTSEKTFDLDGVIELNTSQSANDYVTELDSTIKDVISTKTIREVQELRADDYATDSNNASLILDFKPYDIEHLYIERFSEVTDSIPFSNVYYYKVSGTTLTYAGQGNFTIHPNHQNGYETENINTTGFSITDFDQVQSVVVEHANRVDLIDNLVVAEVFGSLHTLDVGTYLEDAHWQSTTRYTNNVLRWSRGSKNIDNLYGFESKGGGMWYQRDDYSMFFAYVNAYVKSKAYDNNGNNVLYNYIIKTGSTATQMLNNYIKLGEFTKGGDTYYCVGQTIREPKTKVNVLTYLGQKWEQVRFTIEYKPYINMRIKQRQKDKRHRIAMLNNSTSTRTDISKWYKEAIEKNNQLGNETISFYASSDTNEIKYELGQKYGEYVLNIIEYTFESNAIIYKGTLTKNYSNRNINTLLYREKRFYSIPDATQSVDRHEVIELNASFFDRINLNDEIKCGIYINSVNNHIGTLNCSKCMLDNNTMALVVEPYDNSALCFKRGSSINEELGAKKMDFVKYVDDNGEFTSIRFEFYSVTGYAKNVDYDYRTTNYNYVEIQMLKDARERPIFTFLIDMLK